jgi:hypothetical protein
MVSYQVFTQTAITTLAVSMSGSSPQLAHAIMSNTNAAGFVFSFAWMFILSAMISSLMFGRERRLTIQFLVSLALTIMGSTMLGLLNSFGLDLSNPNVFSQPVTQLFGNSFFALFYLALPFIVMIGLDLQALRKK